jgi:2-polyprenyl-3-methyl-5-hydroxy-6-metoxy-1,4-benzoquinol methylase
MPRSSAANSAEATYRRIRDWLPKNRDAALVDIGCGPGGLLRMFREKGFTSLKGIDISPECVAEAQQICPHVIQANCLDYLRNKTNTSDVIIAFDVIEHLRKDEVVELLDSAHRALRSGGSLIIQTPNAESPFGLAVRYKDFTHELALETSSMTQLAALSGFAAIETKECRPHVHGIVSAIRYLGWQFIRFVLMAWNLIEAGSAGSGVYSRVFLARLVKK